MTEKERIEWLIELQEHPEQLTDEQVKLILADDEMRQLVRQLGFTKRAFKNQEANDHTPNADDEWETFAAKSSHFTLHFSLRKFAASFAILLVASGLALAAIHIVRQHQRQNIAPIAKTTEVATALKPQTSNLKTSQDTIQAEPHTFDNVPLDKMLQEIASAYHVEVEFENESARSLRFHFVWKREDSLTTIVEKLNTFEVVNITISNNKLIVR